MELAKGQKAVIVLPATRHRIAFHVHKDDSFAAGQRRFRKQETL